MKDFTISGTRIKKEIIKLAFFLCLGFIANIGAIIFYKSNISEILTSIHYVLMFSIILYLICAIITLLISTFKYIVFSMKNLHKK